VLAERVRQLAESDTSRQALRAVKEMQANLPDEILRVVEMRIEAVADRFHRDIQETTESIAKIGEVLERKVEQMTARIAQRQDKEMQVVVERMGDAMHALASLNRPLMSGDRIDLD
jgi:DNA-binding transcriptional regulator GbsR (MarR family)